MQDSVDRVLSMLIGDHRRYSLERRLFNTISLLNAVTNIGGAFAVLISQTHQFLLLRAGALARVECPPGWMSPAGYQRYLTSTLAKLRERRRARS